jgi:hypothetical protein
MEAMLEHLGDYPIIKMLIPMRERVAEPHHPDEGAGQVAVYDIRLSQQIKNLRHALRFTKLLQFAIHLGGIDSALSGEEEISLRRTLEVLISLNAINRQDAVAL